MWHTDPNTAAGDIQYTWRESGLTWQPIHLFSMMLCCGCWNTLLLNTFKTVEDRRSKIEENHTHNLCRPVSTPGALSVNSALTGFEVHNTMYLH